MNISDLYNQQLGDDILSIQPDVAFCSRPTFFASFLPKNAQIETDYRVPTNLEGFLSGLNRSKRVASDRCGQRAIDKALIPLSSPVIKKALMTRIKSFVEVSCFD